MCGWVEDGRAKGDEQEGIKLFTRPMDTGPYFSTFLPNRLPVFFLNNEILPKRGRL